MGPRIVVMGVSGSGKTTVGAVLAGALGVPFVDADDLHPVSNVEKMAAGIPLTDDDRVPWLDAVGRALGAERGIVVACSALKRAYRDQIRVHAPEARFALLNVHREKLVDRIAHRADHFMPGSLLESQLTTLEPLGGDEGGITVSGNVSVAEIVEAVMAALG